MPQNPIPIHLDISSSRITLGQVWRYRDEGYLYGKFIQALVDTKEWEKERSDRMKLKGKKVAWAPDVGLLGSMHHSDDSVQINDQDFGIGLPDGWVLDKVSHG
jgi:hypothetical protein